MPVKAPKPGELEPIETASADELQALQLDLQRLRSRCNIPATAADCGILKGLGELAQPLL